MAQPKLREGKVYRTEYFRRFDKNPTRFASKLVNRGDLQRLRKGLYHVPRPSAFGEVPPSESELLSAFVRGRRYLRTGPSVWNALGLGTTGVEAVPLVYNTTQTGEVELDGRRFEFRRVSFPRDPDPEYFVVDLLENTERAGVDRATVQKALSRALAVGRFDSGRLLAAARQYGSRATERLVRKAIHGEHSAAA